MKGLCTQVTAFMDEASLRQRLTDLRDAGFDGIAFVGVPRTMNDGEGSGVAPTDALSIYDQVVPNRGAILIPTREGEHGRFNFKCDQGATYGMTQLLYSDAIVGFLTEFAKTTDHRPEILLSFGFVPKVETRVGLINWLIQDPGNAAVADEQAFVTQLAETEPAQKRKLMVDLYKRVIDGVADLGFPLSIHLEAAYGASAPAFETFAEMLDYWSPPTRADFAQTHVWADLCEWIAPFRRSRRACGASILAGVSEPSVAELRNRLDGLTIRDAARLGRRLKNLRGAVSPRSSQQIAEQFTAAEALVATRKAAVPAITYPDLPVSERRDEIADGHRRAPGGRRRRRDRVGQDHAAAEDLPRARPRHPRHHRAHPAAPARRPHRRPAHRRRTGHAARRRRRLHRPVHRPGQRPHAGQADDRRHPARRDPARPPAAALRHPDPRRGARAQPQHRLPARLSARAAAAPARPQGDRHVGDHRARTVRRALRRCAPIVEVSGRTYPVEIRYRPLEVAVAAMRTTTIPTTPTTRSSAPRCATRPRRSSTPSPSWRTNRPATCWCSCPASARSATPQKHCAGAASNTEVLPLYARLPTAEQQKVFAAAHRPPGRARHQRRRDVADRAGHPLRRRPRHRADLAVQPPDEGAAAADRADLAGLGRAAGGPLGPRRARRVHPAVLRGRLRRRGRATPTPRSCGRTSPR